jgi:hypothetical protein
MGADEPADEVTPAVFELLPSHPGHYAVQFTPAAGDTAEPVGTLVVTEPSA